MVKQDWESGSLMSSANLNITSTPFVKVGASGCDYTTIEGAIDGGAKNIFITAGTYTVTGDIDVDVANTTIIGENRYSTIVKTATGSVKIFNVTADYCLIGNLGIDPNNTAGAVGLYVNNGASFCRFSNLFFDTPGQASSIQLYADDDLYDIIISNCTILTATGGHGISLTNTGTKRIEYTKILNNHILCADTNQTKDGIYIVGLSGGEFRYCVVANNTIDGVAGADYCDDGIKVDYLDLSVITGNVVSDVNGNGILISANADNNILDDNIVTGANGTAIDNISTTTQLGINYPDVPMNAKLFSQDAEPTTTQCKAGQFCFWEDTNDSDQLYLCYNEGTSVKVVAMA